MTKLLSILTILFVMSITVESYGQTQTVSYKLQWEHGAILADQSNKPDGNIVQRRISTGSWTEIGRTVYPVKEYNDQIANDSGGNSVCYRVSAFNATGSSAFTPEACVTTPIVQKIPSVPNNNAPVIIILGPVSIVP